MSAPPDDAQLQHLCDLSAIAADMVRHPDFAADYAAADARERQTITTCLTILADTALALMQRQGITPAVRMPPPSPARAEAPADDLFSDR